MQNTNSVTNEEGLKPLKIEITESENPLFSPNAKKLSECESFKNDMTISLFNNKTKSMNIEEPKMAKKEEVENVKIDFKSEIPKLQNIDSSQFSNREIQPARYLIGNQGVNQESIFHNFPEKYSKFSEKVLQIEARDNAEAAVEPILYTAFLMSGTNIVSEPWFFAQTQTKTFFDKAKKPLDLNLKTGIVIKTDPAQTVLMIFAQRIIQVDAGGDVTKFYKKPTPKGEKLAKDSVNLTFPRCIEVWNPFAFTFATVADLISKPMNEGIDLPQLFLRDGFFKPAEVNDMLKKARNKSFDQIPIKIHLAAEVKEMLQPQQIESDGFSLTNAIIIEPENRPIMNFRNDMRVKIVTAVLKLPPKVKGRNVVAKVSMYNGKLENGKISRDRFNNLHANYATCVCYYHETRPLINDTFIIELPYVLDPSASIRIELFHAIAQKSKEQWSSIGWAELPFFTVNGEFIIQGQHDIPVLYNANIKVPLEDNHITIDVAMESNLFTSDRSLFVFMKKGRENKCDSTLLKPVKPQQILENLVGILDVLTRSVITSGSEIIKSMEIITEAIGKTFPDYEKFINNYAANIAFQEKPDVAYPAELINCYKAFLDVSDFNEGKDIQFVDFIFILIVKSIALSSPSKASELLVPFAKSYGQSVFRSLRVGLIQCKKLMSSYARFINLLASIGLVKEASEMVDKTFSVHDEFFKDPSADDIAIHFLKNTWNPTFFIESISKCDVTVHTVLEALKKAKNNHNSLPIQGIYDLILGNASVYTEEENTLIAVKLVGSLSILCPASELPFASGTDIHNALVFLVFILSHIREEEFLPWWKDFENKNSLFNSIHFLLDRVSLSHFLGVIGSIDSSKQNNLAALEHAYSQKKEVGKRNFKIKKSSSVPDTTNPEATAAKAEKLIELSSQTRKIICASHFALINILQILIRCADIKLIPDVTYSVYHILCTNVALDSITSIISLVCNMIGFKSKEVFKLSEPPLPKFIARTMELSTIYPGAIQIVDQLFAVDQRDTGSTDRAKSICCRALSCIKVNIDPSKYDNAKEGKWFIELIKNIQELKYDGDEQKGDFLYKKAILLNYSPDAMFDALGELIEHHHKTEYYAEELQVRMMRCALIAENLAICGRINDIWDNEHPAESFASLCENFREIISPFTKSLVIPSFCDSPSFSLTGFIKEVIDAISVATEFGYYEVALSVSEFAVPLLESNNMFAAAGEILTQVKEASQKLSDIKVGVDRLLGRYYRVTFYGKQWGDDDGKCYIYREKKLTNLYTLMGRLRDEFTKKFGACEAIMESGAVNVSKLDPNKAYFQPTSVEALLDESELKVRLTPYEKGCHLTKFYLDAPFTKNGKAQGTVETQWLRRTIITPEVAMPCATKRVLVKSVETVEYEPIRVACRQLRDRVNMLKTAVQNCDGPTVQQLLSGSLMVQVNEGPSRMAEVFLKDNGTSKYQNELREIFKDFLSANEAGLRFHANYIINNPMFSMMQHEMEAGLDGLREKLSKFM